MARWKYKTSIIDLDRLIPPEAISCDDSGTCVIDGIPGSEDHLKGILANGGEREWEKASEPRKWLYQTPEDILLKASNGASDFGNKFGQPLICGSVLTFEFFDENRKFGYDKVIMLAGGNGYDGCSHAISFTNSSLDTRVLP